MGFFNQTTDYCTAYTDLSLNLSTRQPSMMDPNNLHYAMFEFGLENNCFLKTELNWKFAMHNYIMYIGNTQHISKHIISFYFLICDITI